MENNLSAQKILDNIFNIMQRLYDEMRLNKNQDREHLKVFEIFAELGRTLVEADRASFWRWDKLTTMLPLEITLPTVSLAP